MIITLHGTGAGLPNRNRLASCNAVDLADGTLLLLDVGEAASRALVRDGVDLMRVSRVAVSHMHADHWTGLPELATAWVAWRRTAPVDLYLPPDTADFFEEVFTRSYLLPERRGFEIRYHELAPVDLPGGWHLDVFDTTHLVRYVGTSNPHGLTTRAVGFILTGNGLRAVFSGDLGSAEDLSGRLEGADLLVCESAHIDTAEVLRMAAASGVGRVVFTHVPDDDASFPASFDAVRWSVASEPERIEL